MSYTPLTVLDTREEIGGIAKTVMFDAPDWRWRPGQHLPFRFIVNGEEQRRSYSISSPPADYCDAGQGRDRQPLHQ